MKARHKPWSRGLQPIIGDKTGGGNDPYDADDITYIHEVESAGVLTPSGYQAAPREPKRQRKADWQ